MSVGGDEARRFRARLLVYPRREILDPQGKAISAALARLDFTGLGEIRVGKSFDLELRATDLTAARERVEQMCRQLLANPITEDFEVELEAVE